MFSLRAINYNLSTNYLKVSKSFLWILSGVSFFLSNYFIKKRVIINGDIFLKLLISILIIMSFFISKIIFIIIPLYGLLEGFNTISHLEMLKKDNDNIELAQKDMVINLVGYISKTISAFILLNINSNVALFIIIILLIISFTLECKLYKSISIKNK